MAKPADLRSVLQQSSGAAPERPDAPGADPRPDLSPSARSRIGRSNVTGYYPMEVKKQLKILAAERNLTIQALLAEALNDLFAKHGRPEIVPVGD